MFPVGWIDRFIEAYAEMGPQIKEESRKHANDNWKKAMQLQPHSSTAIYAIAVLCTESSGHISGELKQMLNEKDSYTKGDLEKPEVACQLRRIVKHSYFTNEMRKGIRDGIKSCIGTGTFKECFHLGFVTANLPTTTSQKIAPNFSELKEVWKSCCKILELDETTESEAQQEVQKTLEDCVAFFQWNMREVDLSKEFRQPPFCESRVLVEMLGLFNIRSQPLDRMQNSQIKALCLFWRIAPLASSFD